MPENTREKEFIRRKFTITESLDDVLTRLAEQHYQGNVSLCLRAAIEDHRETLSGEGSVAMQRVLQQLDQLERETASLYPEIEESGESVSRGEESEHENAAQDSLNNPQQAVVSAVKEAEQGLTADDLVEQVDIHPRTALRTLATLLDNGYVHRERGQEERYRLAGGQGSHER